MRKQLRLSRPFVYPALIGCFFLLGPAAGWLTGGSMPAPASPPAGEPVFPQVPDDTIVNCLEDVPPPVALTATDDNDPSFPKQIQAVDIMNPNPITACGGGIITRQWTAVDIDNNTTIVEQIITVLPDQLGPVVDIPEVHDTVPCGSDDFPTWLNTLRLQISILNPNVYDDCGDIVEIDYAPKNLPAGMGPCETRLITFTLTDACGNTSTWQASYSTVDREKPRLTGVPADVAIGCQGGDPPPPPVVTATDNCTPDLTVTFREEVETSPDCPQFNRTIIRTWTAVDACGNDSTAVQRITIGDQQGPSFTKPADVRLICGQDPNDLKLTGEPFNLSDECDPSPRINFTDQILREDCPHARLIQRNWMATDACGNVAIQTQLIEIVDEEAPTFLVPADVTVACDRVNDPDATGRPTQLADNCDPAPAVRILEETVIQDGGDCPNRYEIRRVWRATDACGNTRDQTQRILVTDDQPPVFAQPPTDLTLACGSAVDVAAAFADWIARRGGAAVTDNCSLAADIRWLAVNTGTQTPAALPAADCPAQEGVLLTRRVDFIAEDECGNRTTRTATFTLVDQAPPLLRNCPEEVEVNTSPGACTGVYSFRIPQIEENCAADRQAATLRTDAPITSQAPPGQEGEVPVDPVELRFSTNALLPLNTAGEGSLLIRLLNADAEEAGEFFRIRGEDGSDLGRTAAANQQCGVSQTTLTLTRQQIEAWAADGVLTIRLEPNIPAGQPGRFAINALCVPAGRVESELRFDRRTFEGLTFRYRIDNGGTVAMTPGAAASVTLTQGVHLLTYIVTDCGGNTDSCSYFVRVVDRERPVLDCPADITITAPAGACRAMVTLPLPASAADNCSIGSRYSQLAPAGANADRFTFRYDPNLNDYLAEDKTLTFTAAAANASGPATLTIDFQGDFQGAGAFVRILGEDGSLLGQTAAGAASCSAPGQLVLTIPQATINAWAADGRVTLRAEVNDITVPPGVKGDGINPCDPDAVDSDGDSDGVSFLRARLSYDNLLPSYYAEGVTTLSLAQMQEPTVSPVHEFAVGETTVFYLQADAAGNVDTCSFRVIVRDAEPPVARCQPTTVFINPAGTGLESIQAMQLDAGSADNCAIDTMFITPSTFTCSQAGSTVDVRLTVRDRSGNEASCMTPVRIETLKPEPAATSGICGNDTLYLFANPPPATGGIVFTYRWTGPRGFVSDRQNPVIPRVTSANAGSYIVEITGITGCRSSGTVEVSVEDLPLTPQLITDQDLCVEENIVLTSSVVPVGSSIIYRWYRGVPPNGTLVSTTPAPSFTINGPHPEGTQTYYLTVESGGCVSAPSAPVTIQVTKVPAAVVDEAQITVCEGRPIALGTPLSGAGLRYQWTGPNGFTSTNQFPPVIPAASPANAGVYKLVVSKNGCSSGEATVIVNVLPRPPQPQLSNTGPVCEGEEVVLTTNISRASVYRWIAPSLEEFVTTTNRLVVSRAGQESAGVWRVAVSQFGCDSDLSPPSNVVVNANPPTAAAASQNVVCEGDKLQLFASPAIPNAIYRWTGPNGYSSATQNPVRNNITKADEGTYQVTITTTEGCSGTASVTVVVQRSPVITALSNDAPDCLGGPTDIRLAASVFPADPGTYRYRWTGPNGYTSSDSIAVIRNASEANNGNYQLVVTTADGCVSAPAITTVAVANPPSAPTVPAISPDTPAPFCEGKTVQLLTDRYSGVNVVYFWRTPKGIISTTAPALDIPAAQAGDSGPYSVYVTVNGCQSQESGRLTLSISRTPVVTISTNSPVCEGNTLELRTQAIPGATYNWTGPGFTSSLPNPDIPNASPDRHDGVYSLRATLNGCVSNLVTSDVRVRPAPVRPAALNDGPVCVENPGAELILSVDPRTATPGATYTWSDPGGPIVEDTSALTIRLQNLRPYGNGNVSFTVQARLNGCSSVLSLPTVAQLNTIPPNQAFAGDDFTACEGFATELRATSPTVGAGRWTLIDGPAGNVAIANPDQAVTAVIGLEGGEAYRFRWTLSNGACVDYSFDEVAVEVTESEVVNAGVDILTCESEEVILDATPVLTGRASWSQTDVQARLGVVIEEPANPKTRISGLEAGNLYSFRWTVTGGCGDIIDEVFVLISDPDPFAGIDQTVCNDAAFAQLAADDPTEGSRGRWSALNPGITFSDPRDPLAVVEGLIPGPNVLVWTIDDGICGDDSRDTVVINYKENPVAVADTVVVAFGRQMEFDPRANDFAPPASSVSITRFPEKGTVTETDDGRFIYTSNANFVGTERLTYQLCSEACECSTATVSFVVGEDARCDIPTIFTPNNDGVNDFFVVPCLLDTDLYPSSQVIIFNRWGDEVYRSASPYRNDWRGTFNGEDLPVGTYFYLITLGDGSAPLTGFIMLQR